MRRFAAALETGDLATAGVLLRESHASLRDDYEVSIPELDLLVDLAIDAGALGARLLGGGFGGSVLVLARAQAGGGGRRGRSRPGTGSGGNRRRRAPRPRLARREPQPNRSSAPGGASMRREDVREPIAAGIQPVPRVSVGTARGRAEPSLRMVEAEHGRLSGLEVRRVPRLVEIRRGEVARREGDHRHALDIQPEALLAGERETPDVAVTPVLLRKDVRHVLVGHGAPKGADDRRGETVGIVLPRAAAEPLEPLEPRREQEHDADPRQVAEVGAEADVVLDEQRARLEHAVALPVDGVVPPIAARHGVHDVDCAGHRPDRLEAMHDAVETQLEPAPEHAGASTGQQPEAVVVGCRPPQLQHRAGMQDVPCRPRPASSASVPVVVSMTARVPPLSSVITPSASTGRTRDTLRARGARRDGSGELLPCHLVACRRPRRRPSEEEAERDEPLAAARGAQVEANVERSARLARRATAACRGARAAPSTVSSHSPLRSVRSAKSRRLWIRNRRPPSPSTETGRETNFSSYSPG